jgi:predicted phosphodiesterase/uncharacterized Zn finger protein (UPF0148 family)
MEKQCIECNYNGDGFSIRGYKEDGKIQLECPKCGRRSVKHLAMEEVVNDTELAQEKKIEKYKSKLSYQTKLARKAIKDTIAVEEYIKELTSILKKYNVSAYTRKTLLKNKTSSVGIVQLSDLHFNELVDMPNNSYDFYVASKRLKKLADKTKLIFKTHGITQVLVALTGDLLNSDRRRDELLNMTANRAVSTVIAQDLLTKFILDLNSEFDISIVSIVGNEGRVNDEHGFSNITASDNYDYMISQMIKYNFINSKTVTYIDSDANEVILTVGGKNILFLHGFNIKSSTEEAVAKLRGKYASHGVTVDYVIFGHMHSARLGDMYGRSSSLVGSNAYSEDFLGLTSKASQNLYIITDDGSIDGVMVDLQNTSEDCYDIYIPGECYNPKSVEKTRRALIRGKVGY